MAALTQFRDTIQVGNGINTYVKVPLAAGAVIFQGGMVCVNAAGDAIAAAVAGVKSIGRARQDADNTAGAAGDLVIEVDFGTFRYANDATNPVVLTGSERFNGAAGYVLDDQTIDNGTGTGPAAGIVIDATADYVDILIHPGLNY